MGYYGFKQFMHSFKENYLNHLIFGLDELTTLKTIGEFRGKQALYYQQTPEALASLQKASMIESSESSNRIEGVIAPHYRIEKLVLKEKKRMSTNQTNIDLLFRSGREKRISGFFPYHTFYSELYFSDKLWPDIRIADIIEALKKFNKTDRRFGK